MGVLTDDDETTTEPTEELAQLTGLPRDTVLMAVGAGLTTVKAAGEAVAYGVRVAGKVETLLDELTALAQETRPLIREAAPLIPQIAAALGTVSETAEHVDGIVGVVATLPDTQQDVRVAVETLQTLVGLVNLAIAQLEAIPGARLVRKRITQALTDQRTGRPST